MSPDFTHATETMTYDRMGRVIQRDKTIGGLNFSTSSTFKLASQPLTQTLPNQTTISRHYNSVGQLESITSKT